MAKLITTFLVFLFFFIIYKNCYFKNHKNKKLSIFKKKFNSKEYLIKKIFTRDNEKKNQDPNIDINIGIYENEEDILLKSNIHRSRLARFKKSKLNGEYIYLDSENNTYKLVKGKKRYI
tara:strand:+ start:2171 stop:2527 length:357 start_codon:yes stop_codon:yes gene_type:complete